MAGWIVSHARESLQARITGAYVLITAVAIVAAEAILLLLVLPPLATSVGLQSQLETTASDYVVIVDRVLLARPLADPLRLPPELPRLGDPVTGMKPGEVRFSNGHVVIPYQPDEIHATQPVSAALILDSNGTIIDSSSPAMYRVGTSAYRVLPFVTLRDGPALAARTSLGAVTYVVRAILRPDAPASPTAVTGRVAPSQASDAPIGWVYVQVPGDGTSTGPLGWLQSAARSPQFGDSPFAPVTELSALLLVALLPVGVVFGLLTTRPQARRLRQLAQATVRMAEGDLTQRVPTGGPAEMGLLETSFNTMAEQLQRALEERGRLIEDRARMEERARMARELHDSISQDLFSINLVARGLQRSLPADSPLQGQLVAMRQTIDSTTGEMRAMLLELRPAALDERGLVSALSALCAAYSERLNVVVAADLEAVDVVPPADHALLRIAQEGLSNAVRHSEARRISLHLGRRADQVELVVSDDGRGFDDQAANASGLGLHLMRERAHELGGSFDVSSAGGRGTTLTVRLPGVLR
jgi:signal transduction histidine kinase